MKIVDVKTTCLAVPFKESIKWGLGSQQKAGSILVQVFTDEGIVGLGETIGPSAPLEKTIIDQELRPRIIGQDPTRLERILHIMEAATTYWYDFATYATAAVDVALFDIVGKTLNTPLYNLLGGLYAKEVPFAGYIFIDTPEKNSQQALRYAEQGFTELKMKVGRKPEEDIQRVKAVRDSVGNDIKIRIDANQQWSPTMAVRLIRKMEKFDLQMVEQPVPRWDLNGMSDVCEAVDVPIAADESCWTIRGALQCIEKRAADVFIVRNVEAGSLLNLKTLTGVAEAADIPCVFGTWAEAGVLTSAMLHFIASSKNFPFANDTIYNFLVDDILADPFEIRKGAMKVPNGPGLGVILDDKKVSTYESRKMDATTLSDLESAEWIRRCPTWF